MSARFCPRCGYEVDYRLDAAELYKVLASVSPHHQVYKGQHGGWYITYSRLRATDAAVMELITAGKISPVYSNSSDAYHIGRTWDYERTMDARRRWGKRAPQYFVGDP